MTIGDIISGNQRIRSENEIIPSNIERSAWRGSSTYDVLHGVDLDYDTEARAHADEDNVIWYRLTFARVRYSKETVFYNHVMIMSSAQLGLLYRSCDIMPHKIS